jgi:hypothetical protein
VTFENIALSFHIPFVAMILLFIKWNQSYISSIVKGSISDLMIRAKDSPLDIGENITLPASTGELMS